MKWIKNTDAPSRHIMMVSPEACAVFYEGEYSLDEIQTEIEAGKSPTSFTPESGELFDLSDIEYVSYDPTKQSIKLHRWGGTDKRSRFINGIVQDKAHELMMAAKAEWSGVTYTTEAHSKMARFVVPVFALLMIALAVVMLWVFYENGMLTNPGGSARVRILLTAIGSFFQAVGKPGIVITGVLASIYPVWNILKVGGQANPIIEIVHRSDIKVSASDAVDRETSKGKYDDV